MPTVRAAFRAECATLGAVLRGLSPADLDRPTGCPPWAVRELIAHVSTGAGRLTGMLAAPAPGAAEVDAAGYFGATKFAPEVDRARIDSARREARELPDPAAVAAEFDRAWQSADDAVGRQPPGWVVRTRHGDAMALAEFLVTRVVEVGVHGLDLAAALGREPWLTPAAAEVTTALLTGGRDVPAELGWDRLALVGRATGRVPLTDRERAVLDGAGMRRLAFAR
ncbi:maleylpyruvate isomerase N-terminal domain-containing protein [Micromonospora rubida]|uniref:maleylpyruvate isomerase N-terminal domain-containing protein n=1 Tax=Micromonospora rubida TaxID=2697657 RepID=UPI001377A535|nr:maleylpyruvate isomerase N-terminal domain-containing protein [Micromonospora rubida]NBE84791.1 maleylpyruvate isomerase family mycothiol-dependent enzyme [Micromonospora rubida]